MTQDQMRKNPEAIAELQFEGGWNLSPAGTVNPLRYWSHVHFKNDPKWGREIWTLFVELQGEPVAGQRMYQAKIFFIAPGAPQHFFRIGQEFDLCVGSIVKGHGVIKEVSR
jgi:hypothetical protein